MKKGNHTQRLSSRYYQFHEKRSAFNKFPDFFVQAFTIVLKIHYVIAIHLMR